MGIPFLLFCVTDVDSRSSGQASPLLRLGTIGVCFQLASPSPGLQQEEGGGGGGIHRFGNSFTTPFISFLN